MIPADRAAHRDRLVAAFGAAYCPKYDAGHLEHGGVLERKPHMIAHAAEEVLDQWSYLSVAGEQWAIARRLLGEAITEQSWEKVERAFNVLEFGNEDGETEEHR